MNLGPCPTHSCWKDRFMGVMHTPSDVHYYTPKFGDCMFAVCLMKQFTVISEMRKFWVPYENDLLNGVKKLFLPGALRRRELNKIRPVRIPLAGKQNTIHCSPAHSLNLPPQLLPKHPLHMWRAAVRHLQVARLQMGCVVPPYCILIRCLGTASRATTQQMIARLMAVAAAGRCGSGCCPGNGECPQYQLPLGCKAEIVSIKEPAGSVHLPRRHQRR